MSSSWDDVREQHFDVQVSVTAESPTEMTMSIDSSESIEEQPAGADRVRIVRRRQPLAATVPITSERLPGPHGLCRLTIVVWNYSVSASVNREDALRSALVGCHLLVSIEASHLLSLLDPPEWARGYVEECVNTGTFPVLLGNEEEDRLLLSSPIILYDHPAIAPESPTSLFDALEIDEILTLRTMTLTDDEKREARATDPRTAANIDHVDHLPPEMLDRLHGAIRSLQPATSPPTEWREESLEIPEEPWLTADAPWWDPGADASVSPTT